MEGTFTVEEAASILDCDRSVVYELIADRWLHRPEGKTKKETGGKVTQKSLYQFVIIDRLSRLPVRALKELKNNPKLFEKSASKKSTPNRLSIGEEEGEADPSPNPEQVGTFGLIPHDSPERKRCLHHDFAEQHQFSFGWRARQLVPDDPSLQDDLVQEMSLAVLQYGQQASSEYLLELANNRAIDYLRYEAARGTLSLKQARHASDKRAEQVASLKIFIGELIQRGVPAEWIEEVIGQRLDVA